MQGNDVTAAFSKMKVEGPSSDAVNHKENSPGKVRYRKVRGVRYSTKSQEHKADIGSTQYVVRYLLLFQGQGQGQGTV